VCLNTSLSPLSDDKAPGKGISEILNTYFKTKMKYAKIIIKVGFNWFKVKKTNNSV
jgi:hypothetical protein